MVRAATSAQIESSADATFFATAIFSAPAPLVSHASACARVLH